MHSEHDDRFTHLYHRVDKRYVRLHARRSFCLLEKSTLKISHLTVGLHVGIPREILESMG